MAVRWSRARKEPFSRPLGAPIGATLRKVGHFPIKPFPFHLTATPRLPKNVAIGFRLAESKGYTLHGHSIALESPGRM